MLVLVGVVVPVGYLREQFLDRVDPAEVGELVSQKNLPQVILGRRSLLRLARVELRVSVHPMLLGVTAVLVVILASLHSAPLLAVVVAVVVQSHPLPVEVVVVAVLAELGESAEQRVEPAVYPVQGLLRTLAVREQSVVLQLLQGDTPNTGAAEAVGMQFCLQSVQAVRRSMAVAAEDVVEALKLHQQSFSHLPEVRVILVLHPVAVAAVQERPRTLRLLEVRAQTVTRRSVVLVVEVGVRQFRQAQLAPLGVRAVRAVEAVEAVEADQIPQLVEQAVSAGEARFELPRFESICPSNSFRRRI